MAERRFEAGQSGALLAIRWRVAEGKKKPGDLRLDICSPHWCSVPMSLGFLMADFFHENEDHLYPPDEGFQGGRRYMHFCEGAVFLGWETAVEQMNFEKEKKAA